MKRDLVSIFCQLFLTRWMLIQLGVFSLIFKIYFPGLAFGSEYLIEDVESIFISKLSEYINWSTFYGSDFNIIVLGQSKLTKSLQKISENKKILGKKVSVRTVLDHEKINNCNILIIPENKVENLGSILQQVEGHHILTVSRSEGYAEKGVMVNFYEESGKLRFEINLKAAKAEGFQVSSQLLKLARIVGSE